MLWLVSTDRNTGGVGRVITDYATFAWLTDVFIVDEYRGKGFFDNPENFLTRPYGQMYTSGNFDELIFEFFKGEKKHKYH